MHPRLAGNTSGKIETFLAQTVWPAFAKGHTQGTDPSSPPFLVFSTPDTLLTNQLYLLAVWQDAEELSRACLVATQLGRVHQQIPR